MRYVLPSVVLLAFASAACAQEPAIPFEAQIALALQAAPEDMREGATVQGYGPGDAFQVIREGTNDLICMAPNPAAETFEVSCHAAGLEEFFARGRELRAAGIDGSERTQARWAEYEAGTLPIPTGTTNYIMTGSGYDPETFEIRDAVLRWVIYMPGATPESTGLATSGEGGAPWLMFPGTPGAHIMIMPPGSAGGG